MALWSHSAHATISFTGILGGKLLPSILVIVLAYYMYLVLGFGSIYTYCSYGMS